MEVLNRRWNSMFNRLIFSFNANSFQIPLNEQLAPYFWLDTNSLVKYPTKKNLTYWWIIEFYWWYYISIKSFLR